MDDVDEASAGRSLIEDAWNAHRPHLINLAYAMLRDITGAEDATQEAFARLARADIAQIDDLRGWLIVVTSRICLDVIGSARARREVVGGAAAADMPSAVPGQVVDPADRVTLDDEVRLALLVVLARLTPPERVAFVLHDVFGLPYATVSEAVGRPVPACRQLAHRARLAIHAERPAGPTRDLVGLAEQRLVTERFIAACANGDLAGLLAVLAPDVDGGVDLGPADRRSGITVHGARAVAGNLLRFLGPGTTMVEVPALGPATVLAFVAGRLYAMVTLTVGGTAITGIHATASDAKLAQIAPFV